MSDAQSKAELDVAAAAGPGWLPGIEDQLGWGVNIFSGYYQTAKQRSKLAYRLIDATKAGAAEDFTYRGKDYKKPEGVAFGSSHDFDGKSYVFSSKTKVIEHWQEEADVKGSYRASLEDLKRVSPALTKQKLN